MRITCVVLLAVASSVASAQPIFNPGFEVSTSPWYSVGTGTLTSTSDESFEGQRSGRLTGRTAPWNGITQSLQGDLDVGHVYRISARVFAPGPGTHRFQLTVFENDADGDQWSPIAIAENVPGGSWRLLTGAFKYEPNGPTNQMTFYAEGPAAGVDLYLDDVVFEDLGDGTNWEAAANARIDAIRERDVTIEVVDTFGTPVAGASVELCQTSHAFGFGSAISGYALGIPPYDAFFAEHFEWAVPENACKWPQTEPLQGQLDYTRADNIVAFCQANGIRLRGHTVFWAVDQFVQSWVQGLDDAQLLTAMTSRIDSLVSRFDGVMEHWDVNNEMLHGRFYAERLGDVIRAWMFQQADLRSPNTRWFVNDYSVVSGAETGEYVDQIQTLIADGAPVEGIGVQCHFGGDIDPLLVRVRLDQLAALGLPIWATELDVGSPDPQERADLLETAYRSLFSHPSVDGVLLWGFWAGAHWRAGEAELLDLDFSVNAAGQRYLDLRDEWSTLVSGTSTPDGTLLTCAFHGAYDVTLSRGRAMTTRSVDVPVGTAPLTLTVVIDLGCAADWNGNGGVTVLDLLEYLSDWFDDDPSTEQDGVSGVTVLDLLAFLAIWFEGC